MCFLKALKHYKIWDSRDLGVFCVHQDMTLPKRVTLWNSSFRKEDKFFPEGYRGLFGFQKKSQTCHICWQETMLHPSRMHGRMGLHKQTHPHTHIVQSTISWPKLCIFGFQINRGDVSPRMSSRDHYLAENSPENVFIAFINMFRNISWRIPGEFRNVSECMVVVGLTFTETETMWLAIETRGRNHQNEEKRRHGTLRICFCCEDRLPHTLNRHALNVSTPEYQISKIVLECFGKCHRNE